MSKCTGCGVILQNINKEKIGYTTSLNNKLCERCFRIRNYNEYSRVLKDNEEVNLDEVDVLGAIYNIKSGNVEWIPWIIIGKRTMNCR